MQGKECRRGCGKWIVFKEKDFDKKGSTGFFEVDTRKEHTYRRCDNLIRNNKKADPYQTTL